MTYWYNNVKKITPPLFFCLTDNFIMFIYYKETQENDERFALRSVFRLLFQA